MARELESVDVLKVLSNVIVPGLGHALAGHFGPAVGFFGVAVVLTFITLASWFVVGVIAAAHLFFLLTKDPPAQLPTIDFKSLPKKESAAPLEEPKEKAPKEKPAVEAKPEPKPEPKSEAKPEPKPEPKSEAKPEAKPEPQPEPKPAAQDDAAPASSPGLTLPTKPTASGGFERTESKSRIPSFKLSIPKPGEVSEAEGDWPEVIPYLTKKLHALQTTVGATGEFLTARDKTWSTSKPNIPDTAPSLLREIAQHVGGARFEALWSHGWPFKPGQTISLFEQLTRDGKGWRFAEASDDPSALALIWVPSGEVVRRVGSTESSVAPDLGTLLDLLTEGFRVAQAADATQAVMEADHLVVLPADEVDQGADDADFPDFWMGASGPGLRNVGWSFEPPYIRNPIGARKANTRDIAIIELFHDWLTTDAVSPDGAREVAMMAENTVRPVGKVLLEGKVAVAWWGESPPDEVDMFVDHLRGLTYAKSW